MILEAIEKDEDKRPVDDMSYETSSSSSSSSMLLGELGAAGSPPGAAAGAGTEAPP